MKLEAINSGAQWRCEDCEHRVSMITNKHGLWRWLDMLGTYRDAKKHAKAHGHKVRWDGLAEYDGRPNSVLDHTTSEPKERK